MKINESDIERFWNKVDKNTDSGCWEWTAHLNRPGGYGRIKINGRTEQAHRVSWEIVNGKIPSGKVVCHKCANTICVNPEHLFIGTQYENIQDVVDKGRNNCIKGESHRWSKLTREDVLLIRDKYNTLNRGRMLVQDFVAQQANLYNVNPETIGAIIYGRTWRHLL
jgi:hypothetical protein